MLAATRCTLACCPMTSCCSDVQAVRTHWAFAQLSEAAGVPQCASVAAIHAVFPAGRGVKCRHLRIKKRDGCVRTGAPERTARLLADASHCSLCVCPCQAAEGAVWRQEGASSPWQAREQAVAGAERWLTLVCSTGRACMLSCCVPMRRLMLVECTPEHRCARVICPGS